MLIYATYARRRGRERDGEIIKKLMQKIENNINLHKRTLIESHYNDVYAEMQAEGLLLLEGVKT